MYKVLGTTRLYCSHLIVPRTENLSRISKLEVDKRVNFVIFDIVSCHHCLWSKRMRHHRQPCEIIVVIAFIAVIFADTGVGSQFIVAI